MSRRLAYSAGVAGATGLVGRALLAELSAAGATAVHAFVRRNPGDLGDDPRLALHVVDFDALPPFPPLDRFFCALGTTIAVAGSEAAFRRVDLDHVVACARAAHAAGATRFGVVSALGADAGSRIFYSRTKGEMEAAVAGVGFRSVVVARPSMLVGDRLALGQPTRRGELVAAAVGSKIGWLLPAAWRPIEARRVARALVRAVADAKPGITVLDSAHLHRLGA